MNEELYRKAYRTWGIGAQMDMVIEEAAELIQAIRKSDRNGILREQENLVEEMVDVEIMIEQMKVILNDLLHSYPPLYKNKREHKLERLADRLGPDTETEGENAKV